MCSVASCVKDEKVALGRIGITKSRWARSKAWFTRAAKWLQGMSKLRQGVEKGTRACWGAVHGHGLRATNPGTGEKDWRRTVRDMSEDLEAQSLPKGGDEWGILAVCKGKFIETRPLGWAVLTSAECQAPSKSSHNYSGNG